MKNLKVCRKITVAVALSFAANLLSGTAFAAPETPQTLASVTCHAYTAGAVVNVPLTSQDADHLYFSATDSNFVYNAVFHIQENFVYLDLSTRADTPVNVSGNFLLNGVGLSATLTYTQGKTVAQLVCAE